MLFNTEKSSPKKIVYFITGFFIVTLTFIKSPVMAKTSGVMPSFNTDKISASKNTTFEVNLYLESKVGEKVSGATAYIKYPSQILDYSENLSAQPNTECKNNNYKLTQLLATKNDSKSGIVRITKVQIAGDDALPSGKFCFGTLKFTTKPSFWFILPWFNRSGEIAFDEPEKWEIVGPNHTYKIEENSKNGLIKVTETN